MSALGRFTWPTILAFLGVLVVGLLSGLQPAVVVAVLIVLEVSLSVDNAVVNAHILDGWDEKWRQRFIVWGIPIAVFGMRLVFPIAIVAIAASLSPWAVVQMAIATPDLYAATLTSVHEPIAAFGGSFLLMVFWKYFLDEEKDVHWVRVLEAPLGTLTKLEVPLTLLVVMATGHFAGVHDLVGFLLAGIWGVVTYVAVEKLGSLAGGEGAGGEVAIKAGVGGFVYLELLDASFSFDGVIGAFAMSNNIFIIAVGLGIGALYVRELTLWILDHGVLASYKYLEHGAFWAIGLLGLSMFVGLGVELPEWLLGAASAGVLGLALWTSPRKEEVQTTAVTYPIPPVDFYVSTSEGLRPATKDDLAQHFAECK